MSNVIELARYRGSVERGQHQPKPPDGTILIQWQPDGTHSYSISGRYAQSFALTMQALNQVASRVATEVVRAESSP
ncbi:hypothetical protein K7G19_07410 [Cupriavidus sp. DB3]|uniref:hypothetical protein n=1 Tax=Cupriavidus sp. DB3 TaxID=2873259 RepID=UPI001CF40E83|nr:hypothetical protein [Cupriavidus sp. DB3]MCA7083426.1 hypothetical protein [Cupriavidus sp. DB3]